MPDLSPTSLILPHGIFEPAAGGEVENSFSGDISKDGHIINPIIVRSTSKLQYVYANT